MGCVEKTGRVVLALTLGLGRQRAAGGTVNEPDRTMHAGKVDGYSQASWH